MDTGDLNPPVSPFESPPNETAVVACNYYELIAVLNIGICEWYLGGLLWWDRSWGRLHFRCYRLIELPLNSIALDGCLLEKDLTRQLLVV